MCVVSMIMDHYGDEWRRRLPYVQQPNVTITTWPPVVTNPVTQEEVDEFRRLLDRAREYDKRNNEPDCEMESKKQILLDLAKQLGVEVNFL